MSKILKHLDQGHQQTLLNLLGCYGISGEQREEIVSVFDACIGVNIQNRKDPQPQITAAMQHNNWGDDYGEVYGTDDPKGTATTDTNSSKLSEMESIIAELPGARGVSTVVSPNDRDDAARHLLQGRREPSANAKAITRDIVGAEQLALWIDEQAREFEGLKKWTINEIDFAYRTHNTVYHTPEDKR